MENIIYYGVKIIFYIALFLFCCLALNIEPKTLLTIFAVVGVLGLIGGIIIRKDSPQKPMDYISQLNNPEECERKMVKLEKRLQSMVSQRDDLNKEIKRLRVECKLLQNKYLELLS